jgi:hypothetical protein
MLSPPHDPLSQYYAEYSRVIRLNLMKGIMETLNKYVQLTDSCQRPHLAAGFGCGIQPFIRANYTVGDVLFRHATSALPAWQLLLLIDA